MSAQIISLGLTTEQKLRVLERDITGYQSLRTQTAELFEDEHRVWEKRKLAQRYEQITDTLNILLNQHSEILETYQIGSVS